MSALEILTQLQAVAKREADGDKHAHLELLQGIQRLQNTVTTPTEKMLRMRFQSYQNVCVRIAQEKEVLQALVAKRRCTARELSDATGAEELLIVRIMRLVTLIGIANEVGPSAYEANDTTELSVKKGILGDVKYYTDIVLKVCSNMGPIAARGMDVDPHTFTFGKSMFEYTAEHQEYGQAFDDFMTARRAATWARWYEIFPAEQKLSSSHEFGDVLLVDVAGGQGYWSQQFRHAFPNVPGRVIVQDQPHVIIDLAGIEAMVYDFFTPQPILGARFYYFKQILHNWNDEKSALILKNTAAAMDKDNSTLLINDYVLPEEKVGLRAAYMDIAMLVLLGGIERTESQWKTLVESAGLRIVKIWYAEESNEGSEAVIECEKA